MDEATDEERKAMEIYMRESEYAPTLKEKIAIVIDSWDNLSAPDERRAIKRYMNDVEFNRKVQSMYAVVIDEFAIARLESE